MGTIRPGRPWYDTDGKRIQAHGGSIIEHEGVFYWYGENKEKTVPGSGIWHWGVRCYSSTDLCEWKDEGIIIPPVVDDPASPLHPSAMMDRPHILHDRASGRFVCWLKIMHGRVNGRSVQKETVLVADSLLGPYEIVRTGLEPVGMYGGDPDFVIDPVDGRGYYYFDNLVGDIVCADLTADYTDVAGTFTTHFHRSGPAAREAPAFFRRGGRMYLLTSGRTWYFPNPTEAAIADDYHGPWRELGRIHRGDHDLSSFGAQISSVFKHPGKRDLYIALGDRWAPDEAERFPEVRPVVKALFGGDPAAAGAADQSVLVQPGIDTSIADYVWLPIRFEDEVPVIEWADEWSPDDFD